jgi:predicted ester cyclase
MPETAEILLTDRTETEAAARRFYAAFKPGNVSALHDAVAPDWVDNTLPPGRAPGVAGMEQALQQLHGLLPDLETRIVKMLTQDDLISLHILFEGTQEGAFLGKPPTHRRLRFIAFDLHRVAAGRIVESWHLEDNLSLLIQAGVLPPLG